MLENASTAPRRGRGRPTAEDAATLEATLVRVAAQCFFDKGYGPTSMNEVARAAGVSKRTLYARFASKADLFRAIIDQQIRDTGDKVLTGPEPRTLEGMLRVYAENTLQESLRPEVVQLNRLIYSEGARFPEIGEAAWARAQIGVQRVADLLREYAEREGVPCRDPETVAEMFTTMLRGWYGVVMLRGQAATKAEIRAWTDRMLASFLARRGAW
jgi:AcrR family transcriptional regulator